jgi:hypothetical protein
MFAQTMEAIVQRIVTKGNEKNAVPAEVWFPFPLPPPQQRLSLHGAEIS